MTLVEGAKRIEPLLVSDPRNDPSVGEPFGVGRDVSRLLLDLGAMFSCINPLLRDHPVLDFGAGTGWLTEFLSRIGFDVVAFDIAEEMPASLGARFAADSRLRPEAVSYAIGDGHSLPFPSARFGHIFCFDTLHHMHTYPAVFSEFARVLVPGGRAIFVEPGARHSKSPETIAFLESVKGRLDWIERDIVVGELDTIAREAGMAGITMVPHFHAANAIRYDVATWARYRGGDKSLRRQSTDLLASTNYNDRTIFYVDNLAPPTSRETPAAHRPGVFRRIIRRVASRLARE
jgi:SAM-dependent methyltransferase